MAAWSKETYKMVAERLKPFVMHHQTDQMEVVRALVHVFSTEFAADNPRFDRDRFIKAVFDTEA